MEEISKFLGLLRKYRFILIVIPVVTVCITFFLVRNLPNSYISQSQIATGIVDETKQSLIDQVAPQTSQIIQKFSNLIAIMRMKKMVDLVSYKLIIHDLTASKPFRPLTSQLSNMDEGQRRRAVAVYQNFYEKNESLNLYNKEQANLYEMIQSMGYDSDALSGKLSIFRSGDSDFIVVQCETEDPGLSAFVVNELSTEFVKYYSSVVKSNQIKTTNFLSNLLMQKNDTLTRRMLDLRDYKIRNRVLNLDEQSKQLYTRIIEYDDKKQEAMQNTASTAGALSEIDRKFNPSERRYIEATMSKVNSNIISTKQELSSLYDLYYQNDLDDKYKHSIDSLQGKLTEEINRSSDEYINNPLSQKMALVQQKMDLEVKLDLSRYSMNSLEDELRKLNGEFSSLVPKEAEVQALEMKVDIATKEYLDILNRYNQSSLETGFEVKLNIVQQGMPGLAQPSKKMLLVILSGIISFVFCLFVMFLIYFLDDSIVSPKGLANATQSPVLGGVNKLVAPSVDLNNLWQTESTEPKLLEFKNQLRSLRYEIENDLKDRVLVVTSVSPTEGKTLLALSLAFAWKMTNKKVLLIDGNFTNPEITNSANPKVYLEDFFKGESNVSISEKKGSIDILSNRGGDTSLLELATHEQIRAKLDWAKRYYDLIIIETAALDDINQSKEWMLFTQDIVAIFEAGQTISEQKKNFISYLKGTGFFMGWIMNKTTTKI